MSIEADERVKEPFEVPSRQEKPEYIQEQGFQYKERPGTNFNYSPYGCC